MLDERGLPSSNAELDPHCQAVLVQVLGALINPSVEPSPALAFSTTVFPAQSLLLACNMLVKMVQSANKNVLGLLLKRLLLWPMTAEIGTSVVNL